MARRTKKKAGKGKEKSLKDKKKDELIALLEEQQKEIEELKKKRKREENPESTPRKMRASSSRSPSEASRASEWTSPTSTSATPARDLDALAPTTTDEPVVVRDLDAPTPSTAFAPARDLDAPAPTTSDEPAVVRDLDAPAPSTEPAPARDLDAPALTADSASTRESDANTFASTVEEEPALTSDASARSGEHCAPVHNAAVQPSSTTANAPVTPTPTPDDNALLCSSPMSYAKAIGLRFPEPPPKEVDPVVRRALEICEENRREQAKREEHEREEREERERRARAELEERARLDREARERTTRVEQEQLAQAPGWPQSSVASIAEGGEPPRSTYSTPPLHGSGSAKDAPPVQAAVGEPHHGHEGCSHWNVPSSQDESYEDDEGISYSPPSSDSTPSPTEPAASIPKSSSGRRAQKNEVTMSFKELRETLLAFPDLEKGRITLPSALVFCIQVERMAERYRIPVGDLASLTQMRFEQRSKILLNDITNDNFHTVSSMHGLRKVILEVLIGTKYADKIMDALFQFKINARQPKVSVSEFLTLAKAAISMKITTEDNAIRMLWRRLPGRTALILKATIPRSARKSIDAVAKYVMEQLEDVEEEDLLASNQATQDRGRKMVGRPVPQRRAKATQWCEEHGWCKHTTQECSMANQDKGSTDKQRRGRPRRGGRNRFKPGVPPGHPQIQYPQSSGQNRPQLPYQQPLPLKYELERQSAPQQAQLAMMHHPQSGMATPPIVETPASAPGTSSRAQSVPPGTFNRDRQEDARERIRKEECRKREEAVREYERQKHLDEELAKFNNAINHFNPYSLYHNHSYLYSSAFDTNHPHPIANVCALSKRDDRPSRSPTHTQRTTCSNDPMVIAQTTPAQQLLCFPVTAGGKSLTAMFDSGSTHSFVNKNLLDDVDHVHFRPCDLKINLAEAGKHALATEVASVLVEAGSKSAVLDLHHLRTEFDIIIGLHDGTKLGISIAGLPNGLPRPLNESDSEGLFPRATSDKVVEGPLRDLFFHHIQPALKRNQDLPENAVCTFEGLEFPINTGASEPKYVHQYPVPEKWRDLVIDKVNEWARKGYTRRAPVDCPWNHPLLPQPKVSQGKVIPDTIRLCDDVRVLNQITESMVNLIPIIKEIYRKLARFCIVSSLDGSDAYHKIKLVPEDQLKTTFTDPLGRRWYWTVMFFGLKNAPTFFQHFMLKILDEHIDHLSAYLDDVHVITRGTEVTRETVMRHAALMSKVIDLLTKYSFRLRVEKCTFLATRIRVLGFILEHGRRMVDYSKVVKLQGLSRPTTKKQLQQWMGLVNYLRDHVPLLSPLAAPLNKLQIRNRNQVVWTDEAVAAYKTILAVMEKLPALTEPNYDHPILLAVDASQYGVGWILYQEIDNKLCLIHIGSKAFHGAQINYSASKRELLSIMYAVTAVHEWIFGVPITVYCDHRPLVDISQGNAISNRVMRDWWQTLSRYDITMVHRPGVLNVLPDLLSRLYEPIPWLTKAPVAKTPAKFKAIIATASAIDNIEPWDIPQEEELCDKIADPWDDEQRVYYTDRPKGVLAVDDSNHKKAHKSFYEWVQHCTDKKAIDDPVQQLNFVAELHDRTHGGTETMFQQAWREGYYWQGLRKQCALVAEGCDICLRHAVRRVGFHPLKPITCRLPGDHYAIDYAGPLTTTVDGFNYVLVIVDMASRFVVLRPTKTRLETEAADILFQLFADYGIPEILQSDNDSAFTGKVVAKLRDKFSFVHRRSAAYNPIQNGAAEKSVDLMKRKLRRFIQGELRNWARVLPAVQLAMNCTVSARHKSTPFALMFGRSLNKLKE